MESSASNTAGTFYGVGVGPGDPELLTVKAINAIKKVDVIIAPKTEKKEGSVALSIAKPYLRSDVEIVYQTFPMVKGFEDFHKIFENNKREIIKFLNDGKDVAFLTLGDPMFFSTYIYIFRLLKDCGIKIKTIAGVPSFLAIASYIGLPLCYGNDIMTVIPATAERDLIIGAIRNSDVAVLMKVYKNFEEVVDILEKENMSEEAVLVSRCGLEDEKIIKNVIDHKLEEINYLSTVLTRKKRH